MPIELCGITAIYNLFALTHFAVSDHSINSVDSKFSNTICNLFIM